MMDLQKSGLNIVIVMKISFRSLFVLFSFSGIQAIIRIIEFHRKRKDNIGNGFTFKR